MKKSLQFYRNRVAYNQGYHFAIWNAILWGSGYQILEKILILYDNAYPGTPDGPWEIAVTVSLCISAVMAAGAYIRMMVYFPKDTLRCALRLSPKLLGLTVASAVFGAVAAWSTYIAARYSGNEFSIQGIMFYPVVGAVFARHCLKENFTGHIFVGMLLIIIGQILFYISAGTVTAKGFAISMLMSVVAGMAWVGEAVITGKLTDFADSDTVVALRFIIEFILWAVLIAVSGLFSRKNGLTECVGRMLSVPGSALLFLVMGILILYDYVSYFRAVTLLGTGVAMTVTNTSGFATVLIGILLLSYVPSWMEVAGCIALLCGILYTYKKESAHAGIIRTVETAPCGVSAVETQKKGRLPLKLELEIFLAVNGPMWDYELADIFSSELSGKEKAFARNRVRTYLAEASMAGILCSIEDAIDIEPRFCQGKLLSKYMITGFGWNQLAGYGYIKKAEEA